MVATRRLECRAERRAGSSPVARTRYPLRLAWRRCRSHLSPGLTILSYQIIVCGFAAYSGVVAVVARLPHKQKVVSANLTSATTTKEQMGMNVRLTNLKVLYSFQHFYIY